ncbi:peptide deformylase [Bryobacter aggregatus]|uniref:peptide deformylase n=1 Tax=Bryobacter aggregatus TaxID=360054 RepID=UPI0004E1FA67|nr:peptide deformylase [Bryobacter aggregatus]
MIYKIVKYGNPVLEVVCEPVADSEFGKSELKQLVADMFATMYAAKGVGLAAPQIGLTKRITVIDPSSGEDPLQRLVLINPEILSKEGSLSEEEGCLSIPGFREPVNRAKKTTVRAKNEHGAWIEVTGEDLLSRAIQHENDHLDGILFIHRISPLKRDIIRRKIRKLEKAGEWE